MLSSLDCFIMHLWELQRSSLHYPYFGLSFMRFLVIQRQTIGCCHLISSKLPKVIALLPIFANYLIYFSFSSWLGRQTYFGYYVDWFIEALGSFIYTLSILCTGSIYVGIYLYINGMAEDLHGTLKRLDQAEAEDLWPTYVEEIRFHSEILEYEPFFSFAV